MLIYEKKPDGLYCTQVIHGFNKSDCTTNKLPPQKVHNKHKDGVGLLTDTGLMVFVTGDTSVLGGGIQARIKYEHYLS